MSVKPFIFGGNTGHSYEDIKRLRAKADSMQPMRPVSGGVAGFGQGLSVLGQAIAQRVMNKRAKELEAKGRQKFQTRFSIMAQRAANPATPTPQQTAEGGQKPRTFGFDPEMLELVGSAHATPGQKILMQLLLQKQIDSNDELKQMSIERQRLALEKEKNPAPKETYEVVQDPYGRGGVGQRNVSTGRVVDYQGPQETQDARYQMLTPEQTQQLGLPEGAYQQGPKGRISQIGGGGTRANSSGFNNAQATAASYADRMSQAENIIREVEQAGTGFWDTILAKSGVRYWASEDYKRYEQAQRNFINAVLRAESGAVIADSEFDNAIAQYFPQWNDTPEVIAQKRRNREAAIAGMGRAAGKNYEQPQITRSQQGDDGWVSMGGGVRIRRKQP